MAKSLFNACKSVIRDGISGTKDVGIKTGEDGVFIEYYTQEDIEQDVLDKTNGLISECSFGNNIEENVVLVASSEITIPSGYVLTPKHPKKSMVIMCNTLTNNGTISMTGKAPQVKPHDWFIVGTGDGYSNNVVIPAYANNGVAYSHVTDGSGSYDRYPHEGIVGNNGINRQCGSGGTGVSFIDTNNNWFNFGSGSGYAFGGGAGSGGCCLYNPVDHNSLMQYNVDSIYPMKGGNSYTGGISYRPATGGVGHPSGTTQVESNNLYGTKQEGCGGRLIIFCNNIINNGNIIANGCINTEYYYANGTRGITCYGGASGGGAIDLFIEDFDNSTLNLNNITANGGINTESHAYYSALFKAGNGGNGSITLSNGTQSPLWTMPSCFKPKEKYMSKENMVYFLGELVKRLNGE